jgi:hypothetical protein
MIPVFYYLSPQHELGSLREENIQLRERLAELKEGTVSDAMVILVAGMLALTVILMTGFFVLLCLLANVRPVEFFSVRTGGRNCNEITQKHEPVTAIKNNSSEKIPEFLHGYDDRYVQIWGGWNNG